MENINVWILVALCVVAVVLFLAVRVTKGGSIRAVLLKTLASFLFVSIALVGALRHGFSQVGLFVVLGLVSGLIGDILLDLKVMYKEQNDAYFKSGTAFFALGHIFYITALIYYVVDLAKFGTPLYIPILIALGSAIIVSIAISFSTKLMKLNFGKLYYVVAGYTLLLTFTTALSICFAIVYSSRIWVMAVGLIFFLLSDMVLSMNYFGGKENSKPLIILNHALYYAGQILIALFLSFAMYLI